MKKKTTKKTAVKKQPAAKPKEHSYKFTTRLGNEASISIDAIMKVKNIKALNKAINVALIEYLPMRSTIETLQMELHQAKNSSKLMTNIVFDFKDALNKMIDLKTSYPEEPIECYNCGDDIPPGKGTKGLDNEVYCHECEYLLD